MTHAFSLSQSIDIWEDFGSVPRSSNTHDGCRYVPPPLGRLAAARRFPPDARENRPRQPLHGNLEPGHVARNVLSRTRPWPPFPLSAGANAALAHAENGLGDVGKKGPTLNLPRGSRALPSSTRAVLRSCPKNVARGEMSSRSLKRRRAGSAPRSLRQQHHAVDQCAWPSSSSWVTTIRCVASHAGCASVSSRTSSRRRGCAG